MNIKLILVAVVVLGLIACILLNVGFFGVSL